MKKDTLETKAVRLLAHREHSRTELKRKLSKFDDGSLTNVLNQLEEKGYQSDTRFTEIFVRSRINSGYGPMKIRFDLGQKGIDEVGIAHIMSELSVDWSMLAKQLRERRFGNEIPTDRQEAAKQLRYLASRGFEHSHLRSIFRVEEDV